MMGPRGRRVVGLFLLVAALAGCRTAARKGHRTVVAPAPVSEVELVAGRVAQVNERLGYAVIQCGHLLSDGEEVKVYRDDKVVALLRVTGPARAPFTVADVLRGAPQAGDMVRVIRRTGALAPVSAGKE